MDRASVAAIAVSVAVAVVLTSDILTKWWDRLLENVGPILFVALFLVVALGATLGSDSDGSSSSKSRGRAAGGRDRAATQQPPPHLQLGTADQNVRLAQVPSGSRALAASSGSSRSGSLAGSRSSSAQALVPAEDTSHALSEGEAPAVLHGRFQLRMHTLLHAGSLGLGAELWRCQWLKTVVSWALLLAGPGHWPTHNARPCPPLHVAVTSFSCPKPLGCGYRHACPDLQRHWMRCDKHGHHAAPYDGRWAAHCMLWALRLLRCCCQERQGSHTHSAGWNLLPWSCSTGVLLP